MVSTHTALNSAKISYLSHSYLSVHSCNTITSRCFSFEAILHPGLCYRTETELSSEMREVRCIIQCKLTKMTTKWNETEYEVSSNPLCTIEGIRNCNYKTRWKPDVEKYYKFLCYLGCYFWQVIAKPDKQNSKCNCINISLCIYFCWHDKKPANCCQDPVEWSKII